MPSIDRNFLPKLAYIGTEYAAPPFTGIVLRFPGLNQSSMKEDCDPAELEWGAAGALVVAPFHDPWGWMNPRVVAFVDDLVDGIRSAHGLGPEVPLIATGGSMGGHGALLYSIKSRHRVAACMALCPVCDLLFHYTERPDLPRTMHHAFGSYGEIGTLLVENSPLHQVERLPRIPYLLFHGERDTRVKKTAHTDPMSAAMRARGLEVDYVVCPTMHHCAPFDHATHRRYVDFVLGHLNPRSSAST